MLRYVLVLVTGLLFTLQAGCHSAPETAEDARNRIDDAQVTIDRFKQTDPSMSENFFDTAVAWAVFPDVGKGGALVGGAYGRGVLFENGKAVGYCDIAQGTVGAQLGGQVYSEIIFFENKAPLADFKEGTYELAAQVSAVAAAADASANADYEDGVAVFTLSSKGLMGEASVGGQKFDYTPIENAPAP